MPDELQAQLQQSLGDAYAFERELGGGGMSRVFVAEETALGRRVVVKVLPPETAAGVSIERFKREIMLAARLQHPHIVPLLSAGDANGLPYFTMPFVDGESLRVRLARQGELPVSEAMRILREIATALAYAHERGIVHRDIKPDNVLLSGGSAMVTDFGVAKALSASSNAEHDGVTSLGVALGTPAYMAPEQASADPNIDHRADIYAFGALAYELLTGQPPFTGRTPSTLLAAHVSEPPEPIVKRRSSLPPALAGLVMRCLEKRPADRPQSASEVVHALDDITTPSGGMQPTSASPPAAPPPRAPRRLWPVAGVATVGIIVAAIAAWRVSNRAGAGTSMPDAAAVKIKRIAVLPFQPRAGDTANLYLADGMATDLTAALANVRGIHVVPRSSAFELRGKNAKEAGAALHADAIVEGTIGRVGNRLRVTAELVNIADEDVPWGHKYDVDEKDVFALHDSIASAVAATMDVQLTPDVRSRIAKPRTTSVEAHDLVSRARYLIDQYTEASIRRALDLFTQATRLDSSYADAWGGVADSWMRLADDWVAPHQAIPHIRHAIDRAAALDPQSSVVHLWRAVLESAYLRHFDVSDREFKAAIAIDSTDALAWVQYAMLLTTIGLPDSAVATANRAIRSDPRLQTVRLFAFWTFLNSNRLDAAQEACDRLAEMSQHPAFCRTIILETRGRFREALDEARRAFPEPRDGFGRATLSMALAGAGQTREARNELDRALAYARDHYLREESVARAYVALGDKDNAIAWLERLLASDGAQLGNLRTDPYWASLRSDPRFVSITQRAGLPEVSR